MDRERKRESPGSGNRGYTIALVDRGETDEKDVSQKEACPW